MHIGVFTACSSFFQCQALSLGDSGVESRWLMLSFGDSGAESRWILGVYLTNANDTFWRQPKDSIIESSTPKNCLSVRLDIFIGHEVYECKWIKLYNRARSKVMGTITSSVQIIWRICKYKKWIETDQPFEMVALAHKQWHPMTPRVLYAFLHHDNIMSSITSLRTDEYIHWLTESRYSR